MRVWIGLKQGDEYVSEWTGEIADEGEIGAAIGQTIADYRKNSGQAIWGMTIMIDKAAPQRLSIA
jgi:2-keto-4-pentenoate hydratase/2-oxohepta-3-ene-1,7-dioic acid hydratase in catechol pathway